MHRYAVQSNGRLELFQCSISLFGSVFVTFCYNVGYLSELQDIFLLFNKT